MSSIILIEPEHIGSFGPLTLLRSALELRYGIYTNLERAHRVLSDTASLQIWIRPILAKDHADRYPELSINEDASPDSIFLNGAIPAWHYPELIDAVQQQHEALIERDGVILAAKSSDPIPFNSRFHSRLRSLPRLEVEDQLQEAAPLWIWDFLDQITPGVEFDLNFWENEKEYLHRPNAQASTLQEKQIFIHNTAQVSDFIHLDASKGPIIIDEDSKIGPFSSLTGPLYIGKRCSIKPSANISKSVISHVCNVGGEIKGSIMHTYSNKSHEGYLGDSMVGSWVNLGAGTNVSNLKNNYHQIKVSWDGNSYDTGRQFLGCLIGDHTKTAIGVRLNTGTFIGPFSNIFQSDFPPRAIPSFSWGNGVYELDRAIETAKKVLARRGKTLTDSQVALIKALAKDTDPFTHFS